MVKFTYRGLIAPVFTPFHNDKNFSLNLDVIPKYAQFLLERGINGVLVNGTTGEGTSMNIIERKAICESWSAATKITKQHLMVQVGGAPLPDVLELAQHAENMKVHSILCLPELYFKPKNVNELIDYLTIVGKAAPNTPLLYYHIPQFTNVHINMSEFLNSVTGKIPNFVGIKFTSTCLDEGIEAVKACNRKYAVFLGADTLMLGAYSLGFDSAIATSFNILPQLGINILKEANTNQKEAVKIQDKLSSAINAITKFGNWVEVWKTAMNLNTTINVGPPRPPLKVLSEMDGIEIKNRLNSI